NGAPYAIFSTMSGGALYARTNNGVTSTDTLLTGNWLNAPHLFRIDWSGAGVTYWIDGTQVATTATNIAVNMRPVFSDATVGSGALSVQWMQLTPYNAPGVFDSRVFDAGKVSTWYSMQWTSTVPAG